MNDQSEELFLIGKETKYFEIVTFKNSANYRDKLVTFV